MVQCASVRREFQRGRLGWASIGRRHDRKSSRRFPPAVLRQPPRCCWPMPRRGPIPSVEEREMGAACCKSPPFARSLFHSLGQAPAGRVISQVQPREREKAMHGFQPALSAATPRISFLTPFRLSAFLPPPPFSNICRRRGGAINGRKHLSVSGTLILHHEMSGPQKASPTKAVKRMIGQPANLCRPATYQTGPPRTSGQPDRCPAVSHL